MRTGQTTDEELKQRIRAKVRKAWHYVPTGRDGQLRRAQATQCWEWQGSTCCGIGTMKVDGLIRSVRQVAYRVYGNQPPLNGHPVKPSCGNKACVNPAHLVREARRGRGGRKGRGKRNAAQTSLY